MEFPSVETIASKELVSLPDSASVYDAVRLMKQRNLRDLIVEGGADYRLICADDLIRIKLENIDFSAPLSTIALPKVEKLHQKSSVLDALGMSENESDYLCLIDDAGSLTGVVSYGDLVAKIDPDRVVEAMPLAELLPGSAATVVGGHETTLFVLDRMRKDGTDAALIEISGRLIGILTQKDAIDLFEQGKELSKPVATYMSSPLLSVRPSIRVWEAYEYLRSRRFKRLVITTDDGRLSGVITQRDLIAKSYNRRVELMRFHEEKVRQTGRMLAGELEHIKSVGTVDALTGLFNRQIFSELFRREIARVKRHGEPLSLLILDIDYFKQVNDTFGHLAGDGVLLTLAKELSAAVRTSDLLCRWGGEEFAILLPHTDAEGALKAGEKIRKRIGECRFEGPKTLTVSIGAAAWHAGEETDDLFAKADRALYAAKNGGRDRVYLDNEVLKREPGKIDEVGQIVGDHRRPNRAGF